MRKGKNIEKEAKGRVSAKIKTKKTKRGPAGAKEEGNQRRQGEGQEKERKGEKRREREERRERREKRKELKKRKKSNRERKETSERKGWILTILMFFLFYSALGLNLTSIEHLAAFGIFTVEQFAQIPSLVISAHFRSQVMR